MPSKNEICFEGSVRIDLLGGTLDLEPINLILPNVVTLNAAISRKAKVKILHKKLDGVEIFSKDYDTKVFIPNDYFSQNIDDVKQDYGRFDFIIHILKFFNVCRDISLEFETQIPPGSGLGASSVIGIVLAKGLSNLQIIKLSDVEIIKIVKAIESRILAAGPAGYQDYYPPLLGGVLALKASPGNILAEQLYSKELKFFLENHITLIDSSQTRLSGINNWEVYKRFFDNDPDVRRGLKKIAELSFEAYQEIKRCNYNSFLELIGVEGRERAKLFHSILTTKISNFHSDILKIDSSIALKMCGAGGGGSFILVHTEGVREKIAKVVEVHGMKILDFKIEPPI